MVSCAEGRLATLPESRFQLGLAAGLGYALTALLVGDSVNGISAPVVTHGYHSGDEQHDDGQAGELRSQR